MEGRAFIDGLREMGYFWSILKAAEVIAGTLLIFNVMGQFGVLMLAPLCLGILFFHTFYSLEGSLFGWIAIGLEIAMLFIWRKHFTRLFLADNTRRELQDFDWDEEDRADMFVSERLPGAGMRTLQAKTEKDIDFIQEQEMVSNRPTPSVVDKEI